MEKIIRTNIKQATLLLPDSPEKKDIYIENGMVIKIRDEVRQGLFSGVYEMEAAGRFAVPFFCDCGCFWLGSKRKGYELPARNEREFKQFGFFSFVTTIAADDSNSRLLDQRASAAQMSKQGMCVRYLTGGLKDKAYHINENVYQDICDDPACAGAAVIFEDSLGSIEQDRLEKLCDQVDAAAYDTNSRGVVALLMGDLAQDFDKIHTVAHRKNGREQTLVPWFVNRNRRLLTESVRFIRSGGSVSLVAGPDKEQLSEAYIPLWMALIRIYEENGNLNGVLLSSYSGGYLPARNDNTLPQRGELVYLIENLKLALKEGVPFNEIIRALCFNPIEGFGMTEQMIKENTRAGMLIIDDQLNVEFIIDGDKVISPESFKTPVLFL